MTEVSKGENVVVENSKVTVAYSIAHAGACWRWPSIAWPNKTCAIHETFCPGRLLGDARVRRLEYERIPDDSAAH